MCEGGVGEGGDVGDDLVSVAMWMAYCEGPSMCVQTRSSLEFNKFLKGHPPWGSNPRPQG
jgi:hypothetical protein